VNEANGAVLEADWGWQPPPVVQETVVSPPVIKTVEQLGQATGLGDEAKAALDKAKMLAELAAKLKELIAAVMKSQQAAVAGEQAVKTVGENLVIITNKINEAQYQPLFDGKWTQDDMAALKDVNLYLSIVDTILKSTGQLNAVSNAFVKIIEVLSAVVDLLKSVTELAPAAGDTDVAVLEGIAADATAVAQRCDEEVKKISAAETKLRPPLNEYQAAQSWGKAGVVAKNFDAFRSGFNDVGNAWMSVNAFFNDNLKPAIAKTVAEVGKLKGNVEAFKLPVF